VGKDQGLSMKPTFKTAGQRLSAQIKRHRRGKHAGRGNHVWTRKRKVGDRRRQRGKTRQQRGRGVRQVKKSGVAKRLFGDEPRYPATDYIAQRTIELRGDI